MDDPAVVFGALIFVIGLVVMLLPDETPEMSYKVHKWFQGKD